MNHAVFACEIVIVFALLLIAERIFGKLGVIAWVGVATVLANITTAKTVTLFSLSSTAGTVLFASCFLATDILNEYYDERDARTAVNLGVFCNVLAIVATQICLMYIPNEFDYAQESMKTLFGLNFRISVSSAVMYYMSNMADVILYSKIKKKTGSGKMWLRNNVSTILCNCLENFGFVILAFAGIYDAATIIEIAVSTCVIEIVVAICDTPFLYIAGMKFKRGKDVTVRG